MKTDFVKLSNLRAFVTYGQAAEALGISNRTIRRLAANGKIATTGTGNGKRILKDSLCSLVTKKSKADVKLDRQAQKVLEGKHFPLPVPEPVLTPAQQNALFFEQEARKPAIWVGDVGFQGVDEYGRTAESRAAAYCEALKARQRAPRAMLVRGI